MSASAPISQFLSQSHLALAGVSRGGRKFGNTLLKELTAKGCRVSVIHPSGGEINGMQCFRSLSDLPDLPGGVVICVPPEQAAVLVREAVACGIRHIWLQRGAESSEALDFCRNRDVNLIHGECLLMFAQPAGVHRCHRWLRSVFGRLPV